MISNKSFVDAASKLGCEVAAIKAIASVETKGSAWISPGVPQILYERHIMARLLKAKGISLVGLPSDLVNTVPGGYGKFSEQHGKLGRAVKIDRECALQSCSWGMFQLMGFNYKACGYSTVQAFVNAMYKSEDEQLNAFVGFIKSNTQLNQALRSKDWPTVARLYNGADYKINQYDSKLAAAYESNK
ncbi:peptidoglycan hydrolase [Pseudomonas phage 16Q]|nr:peptidoglycan hydrolase [Pseudomonas phage 16Q]